MKTYTLKLAKADRDALMNALLDYDAALKTATANERQCSNNGDTIDFFSWQRIHVADIMLQIKQQEKEQ